MGRHKLRRIRARQWDRYITRLIQLSQETLCPPGYDRYYNYKVRRHNRAQNTKLVGAKGSIRSSAHVETRHSQVKSRATLEAHGLISRSLT